MITYYDESVADCIYLQIDKMLCKYYNTNCAISTADVHLEIDSIALLPNSTTTIFEISGLMSDYTIRNITPAVL